MSTMSGSYVLRAKNNQPCEVVYIFIVWNCATKRSWKERLNEANTSVTELMQSSVIKRRNSSILKFCLSVERSEKLSPLLNRIWNLNIKKAFSYSYNQNSIKIIFTENKFLDRNSCLFILLSEIIKKLKIIIIIKNENRIRTCLVAARKLSYLGKN